jgi:hypothetical protein
MTANDSVEAHQEVSTHLVAPSQASSHARGAAKGAIASSDTPVPSAQLARVAPNRTPYADDEVPGRLVICFPEKAVEDVFSMFQTRFNLHRKVRLTE